MASLPILADDDQRDMDDAQLVALLQSHEQKAVGYYNGEIADEQAKAINYYYGRMDDLLPEEDCSSVVDRTVAVMVDNGLAAILKPFVSADEVVSFEPRGPEDVAQAEQATEYVNYVINCDNPGFLILHDWFKDAMLTKIGIVKVWWEDQSREETVTEAVDAPGLLAARHTKEYQGEEQQGDGVWTVATRKLIPDGRVKIENVPPEEFLITPFARSLDCPYVAHRPNNFTRSDLVGMGFDPAIVDSLPAYSEDRAEESRRQARYGDEDFGSSSPEMSISSDRSRDVLGLLDEYVRVDYDGDGVSELRRIVRVEDVILLNEEVDECPFAILCPVPMPHKVYGLSIADQAMDGQKISTALLRQTLDNIYKTNNPRPVISESGMSLDTMDDIADTAPGAAIRVKGDARMAMGWSTVPFTAEHSIPMLEMVAVQTEERTGIQRKGQGFNANALRKNSADTATEAAIDENFRNERAEMIARIFAETGVKRLFKLILRLLVTHQPKARVVRLRNQWVEMDPTGWSPEMDLSISVGLGVGNKADQMGQASQVLELMERLQGTPFAYLVTAEKVHNAIKRFLTASGVKNVDDFIEDPSQVEAPAQQPSPEEQKLQGEMALKAQEQQFKREEAAAKLDAQRTESAARIALMRDEAEAQLDLANQKAAAELTLAERKMVAEMEMEERRMTMQAQIDVRRAENDRDIQISKNRSGGDLDK